MQLDRTLGDEPRSSVTSIDGCEGQALPADSACGSRRVYSHSIVDGGLDEMSSATRLTAGISLMIRLEIVSSRS